MKHLQGFSHLLTIGKGAFSTVLRGRQKRPERNVALKIIHLKKVEKSEDIEREANILAQTPLPCLPAVYDVKRARRQIIIVMEWIYGIPLTGLLEQNCSKKTRMSIAGSLVRSLSLLHSYGIAHRDIKPSNIIISPDRGAVFIDFGFSVCRKFSKTKERQSLSGTPAYMAPELWAGDETIDYKKADLFSLGLLIKDILKNDFPQFADILLENDPVKRPIDATEFEKIWVEKIQENSWICDKDLNEAVALYTARILFEGACRLHEKHRNDEAYGLLTESLKLWPDNENALEYLRNNFACPAPDRSKMKVWILAAITALAGFTGAFFAGRASLLSEKRILPMFNIDENDNPEDLKLISHNFARQEGFSENLPIRKVDTTEVLNGTISIILPSGKGTLFIDGTAIKPDTGNLYIATLAYGSYRVEWLDSLKNRKHGETFYLLPFSKKTISLKRFEDIE